MTYILLFDYPQTIDITGFRGKSYVATRTMSVNHTKEYFDKAIYSGLYTMFFYMKHAYPYLKEAKGSVVNFASGAGLYGRTCVFLCSEDDKYISCVTITMQGGSGLWS